MRKFCLSVRHGVIWGPCGESGLSLSGVTPTNADNCNVLNIHSQPGKLSFIGKLYKTLDGGRVYKLGNRIEVST